MVLTLSVLAVVGIVVPVVLLVVGCWRMVKSCFYKGLVCLLIALALLISAEGFAYPYIKNYVQYADALESGETYTVTDWQLLEDETYYILYTDTETGETASLTAESNIVDCHCTEIGGKAQMEVFSKGIALFGPVSFVLTLSD